MSVLVKGMEMPTNGCKDCIFVNRKWHGDVCPILKREVTGNVERGGFQTDCPLVPVPLHGRLIDADALEQDAQGRLLECDKYDNQFNKPFEIMRAIRLAPVIIPADMEWKMKNCCCCDDKTIIPAEEDER